MDAALKWKQKENCKKVHRILTEYRGRKVDVKLKKEYNMIIVLKCTPCQGQIKQKGFVLSSQ